MYFHLEDHIYLSYYKDKFILLNLKEDKYYIVSDGITTIFEMLLHQEFIWDKKGGLIPINFNEHSNTLELEQSLKYLRSQGLIKRKEFKSPYPYYIYKKKDSKGVSTTRWRLPLEFTAHNNSLNFSKLTLEAYIVLSKVHFIIKYKGFSGIIQYIKDTYQENIQYTVPCPQILNHLIAHLNKACLFYHKNTKCLEWAATLVLLALKRKWQCNLIIGVQNYPFTAHAWVEMAGKIVADKQEWQEELVTILSEPFRRRAST
jgi:hypothetical protein